MDFQLTEERRMLSDTIERFVRNEYSLVNRNTAAISPLGFDAGIYTQLADLGVIAALFGEDQGGFGGAGFDLTVVFEDLGKGLVVEPFLDNALMPGAILAATAPDMLEGVIAGTHRYALAAFEAQSGYDPAFVKTTATQNGDDWTLTGRKTVVKFVANADGIIVSAKTPEGIGLFLVEPTDAEIATYPTVDGGSASELHLDTVPAQLLTQDGLPLLETAIAKGIIALSAEALGIMEVIKDMTLEYLRTRKQFGVAIGQFQALQHRMAQLLLEVTQARSAVINAAAAEGTDDFALSIAATKHSIGRIGQVVAEESIQMHGGIGMTWEYDLGHYLKRLTMIDHELGDQDYHLARFAQLSRGV